MAKSPKRPQADDVQDSPQSEQPSSPAGGSSESFDDRANSPYDRDRVASRAYELYEQRGGSEGSDMEDWLTAEREFSNRNPDRRDE
jgi:hypothetical protein